MSRRSAAPYILRAIVVNGLLIAGFVQVARAGKVTGGVIALYVAMGIVANVLMVFAARARRRIQDR